MTVSVESSIVSVDGVSVTPIDPTTASYFNLFTAVTDGPQIAPESEIPVLNPLTGETLRFIDGVVIGSASGGLSGTGTATAGALLVDADDINLTDETTLIVFSFEQPNGSQLIVRATITGGDGPTLEEFVNGYTLDNLLQITDTLNGSPYDFNGSDGGDDGGDEEDFVGDAGPNDFTGSADADSMIGAGGNDTLTGAGGNDTLNGGSGADDINGGAGRDRLIGGGGADDINGGGGRDYINGGGGSDSLVGGGGNDTILGGAGADTIVGGGGADRVTAGKGNDSAVGGAGNDRLDGGAGRDVLKGGLGKDTLIGGNGDDTLIGGGKADRLIGGAGDDEMTGGAGADEFRFTSGQMKDGDVDTITDFADGVDIIAVGVDGFGDLTIADGASGAEITVDGYTLVLEDVAASDLTESDFLFI